MKRLIILAAVTAMLVSIGCGKKSSHDMMDMGNTKLVMVENYQFAFDFMDKAGYKKMMKDMKMMVPASITKDHVVLLTIMDKPKKKVIEDAVVSFSVIGPDKKATTYKTDIMKGGGMQHYRSGTIMKEKGMYMVTATATINGKEYTAKADYMVK